jgi:hypothetical protein
MVSRSPESTRSSFGTSNTSQFVVPTLNRYAILSNNLEPQPLNSMRLSVHSEKSLKFLPKNGKHHVQGHHWKNPPSMKRHQQANYIMDNPTLQEPTKYEEADGLIPTLVNGVIKVKPNLKLQSDSQQNKGQKIVIVGDSHA